MITSGTVSPWTGEAIAMALVENSAAGCGEFHVQIRDRSLSARRVPLPFYRRRRNEG